MLDTQHIRFFDKEGIDMNLGLTSSEIRVVYDNTNENVLTLNGNVFFPKVSTKLIESQQIYILQEVTGLTSSYVLRNIQGTVQVIGGSPTVNGENTYFTELTEGMTIKILDADYEIQTITSDVLMTLTTSVSTTTTTSNIYYYDYLSYSEPRSTPGITKQILNVRFADDSQTAFFLYDINYSEDAPYIERSYTTSIELTDGFSDAIDPLTGRILLSDVNTTPIQINIGISSEDEDIFEETIIFEIENQYQLDLSASPIIQDDGTIVVFTSGTASIGEVITTTEFLLQGLTGDSVFYEVELEPLSVGVTGSDMFTVFKSTTITNIPTSALSSYKLLMKNTQSLSSLVLYGETEGEDERFKLVLENFGKKIDFDKEYIFRESDINEALPDNKILNRKRKELLLEGDSIYPIMGSYKALINVINFFGYYDLDIKEYFLNVNADSPNYNKYTQVLIPRNETERNRVKAAWNLVPSSVYKKTSLFGLFYDLNTTTGEYDEYGTPIVEDAFMFSPEEVLIKLFGLKDLLKQQFLPLNARIVDITGEGIYFDRIRVDAWADNLNYRTLNIGTLPNVEVFPKISYVSDIRRIDEYYVEKFTKQGLLGFLGFTATDPSLLLGSTVSISTLSDDDILSYDKYANIITDLNGNLIAPIDPMWDFMPPPIYNEDFNEIARRQMPLADSNEVVAGAPVLLETLFDLTWEDSEFAWSDLSILGPTGAPLNINLWTWDSIAQGEYIDIRWTVEKLDSPTFFYDSGRQPIDEYVVETDIKNRILHAVSLPYVGDYQIGVFLYDITNNFTIQYEKHTVYAKNADFVSVHVEETDERTYNDFNDTSWDEISGVWYYPNHIESSWDDAKISWGSLEYNSYKDQTLYNETLETSILEINREGEYVILDNNLSHYLQEGNQLFFIRKENSLISENVEILSSSMSRVDDTLTIPYVGTASDYTRMIITTSGTYSTINPETDYYSYVDVISSTGTTITVKGLTDDIDMLESIGSTSSLYMSWGLFSGTYSIEIKAVNVIGDTTKVNLYDINKELYYLDGNFIVTDASYDVDYAENRIGIESVTYGNADEVKWSEIEATWMGLKYHPGTDCGFIIPRVLHGGSITIDEHPTFNFSGDITIDSTYDGLIAASLELNASENEGISKYSYSVLPEIPLTMTGATGPITATAIYGATSIAVTSEPIGIPEMIWTGYEWLSIDSYDSGNLILESGSTVKYAFSGATILLPYTYHTQLIDKDRFAQFYYFIQGKAKNPSSANLSYINFRNGVTSEWIEHPDRTDTYPLKNVFVQGLTSGDYLLDKWIYEGEDYPPLFIAPDYASDKRSIEIRVTYDKILNAPFSYIDTVISNSQKEVSQFTPVMFNYDLSGIPGKTNPKWTITNDVTNEVQVVSTSVNLLWNFTRSGTYTVSLELEDVNGNKSSETKTSFIKVK